MKIIAIDDNQDNLITLKAIIKDNFQDAEVVTTTNGKQGLEQAQSVDPDVVILDVIMPGMDGYEVCRILKSNEQTQDIPIIFLTALRENRENRLKALEVGGDAFLTKPIDETELIAQIRAMTKLKNYSNQKKLEKTNLEALVREKTEELQRTYFATLNLLEDLREENEIRKRKELELLESENNFRSLFEETPIAVFLEDFSEALQKINIFKEQGIRDFTKFFKENPEKLLECINAVKIIDVNREAIKLLRAKDKQELLVAMQAIPSMDAALLRLDEFVHVAKGESKFNIEVINFTYDQQLLYLNNFWAVVPGYESDYSKVIVSMVDITDRKLSEIALSESETRFRMLFDQAPVGYQSLDSEGRFIDVNQTWLDVMGYEREEVIGQKFENFLAPQYVESQKLFFQKFMDQGSIHVDFEMVKKGGELIFVSFEGRIGKDERGIFKQTHCIMQDITEKRKAEAARLESEKRYRSLFEDSPVAIFEEDNSEVKKRINELKQSGVSDFREFLINHSDELSHLIRLIKVTNLNNEGKKLYGLEPNYKFSGHIRQTSTSYHLHLMIEEFVNIANGLTNFQTEIQQLDKEGNPLFLSVYWSVVPGFEEDLSKVIVTVVDITERKELEKRQKQRLAEMEAIDIITSALREASTKEEALPIFLKETLTMLQVEMGSIWLYHPSNDALLISDAIGVPEIMQTVEVKPGEGVVGNVFLVGETVQSSNILQESVELGVDLIGEHPTLGGVCVPIQSQEDILGVLVVVFPEGREVKTEEVRMLEAFARIAGITLHRMNLYDDTLRHLKQLQVQRTIDQTIASIFDLPLTLEIISAQARNYLNAGAAGILIFNPLDHSLHYAATNGFRTHHYKKFTLSLGSGPAGRAALSRKIIHIQDVFNCDPPFKAVNILKEENFVSYFAIPLIAKGELKGILEIFYRTETSFDPVLEEFLESLAMQTAIAIDNLQLFDELQHSNMELVQAYDATIEGWSRAMDLRDKETEEHTLRVTEMAVDIARIMGVSEEDIVHIRRGALLHDIGKMGVPDEILRKPGALTPEEWQIMKQHPVFAYEMIAPVDYLKPALDIPYCHHEKWDGTGYPRGLKGEEIPLAGRIFAVIDVWDALSSDRPYRKAWPQEKVLAYIKEQAGTHFDPEIVNIFLETLMNKKDENQS